MGNHSTGDLDLTIFLQPKELTLLKEITLHCNIQTISRVYHSPNFKGQKN